MRDDIQDRTVARKPRKASAPRKATKSKRSAALNMGCPKCGADIGAPCIGSGRRVRKSVHAERFRGFRRFNPLLDACLASKTESPIEHQCFVAIRDALVRHRPSGVRLDAQVQVPPYRADMMLTKTRGEQVTRLVVECDGRDWHTSEQQVARDKKRDRFFAVRGVYVMRFTGSEIHADVEACAAEVIEWARRP